MSESPITISYNDLLKDDLSPLHEAITQAFGSDPNCLGLLIVMDMPKEYLNLREKALRAAATFAQYTPEPVREKYIDPASKYMFGWSHGKELMDGKPDVLKGSYYANPTSDRSGASEEARLQHPTYLRDNVWPSEEDCAGFEQAFKALSRFMTETGKRLAKACDHLVATHSRTKSIEHLISASQCSKARLLHYYPPPGQVVSLDISPSSPDPSEREDSWCGDHLDHSLLTALCPAMYLFHPSDGTTLEPLAVSAPTDSAGLFIRTRAGRTIRATVPSDCMAFQTGEALQVLTQGKLRATPHYVSAGTDGKVLPIVIDAVRQKVRVDADWKDVRGGVISRETMAVFLQPDVDAVIGSDGETFGQFTTRIVNQHFDDTP